MRPRRRAAASSRSSLAKKENAHVHEEPVSGPGGRCDAFRCGGERLGKPGGQFDQPRARARLLDAACGREGGADGRPRTRDAVPPLPQRRLEDQLVRRPRAAPARLLEDRLRRLAVVHDRRAELRGDARLRLARLHERALPARLGPQARRRASDHPRPRHGQGQLQPRLLLPPHVPRAGGVEGARGLPALRRRVQRLLRVGQRAEGRLCRGLQAAERVQRDEVPPGRRQPARGGGLPLVRRQLPGGPGHVPLLGHLPRRVPLRHAEGAPRRLLRRDGAGPSVHRLEAEAQDEGRGR